MTTPTTPTTIDVEYVNDSRHYWATERTPADIAADIAAAVAAGAYVDVTVNITTPTTEETS